MIPVDTLYHTLIIALRGVLLTWELVPCRGCQPLGACLLGREELVLRPLLESLAAWVAWADGLAAVYSPLGWWV